MIKLENVGKIYSTGNNLSVGIRKINLELNIGEFVAITGESGSGKSTLLNVISGIDSYEEGEMYINGEETSFYSNEDLENYRNKFVGFIFQAYNIIDSYTVLENVEAALLFMNIEKNERRERAIDLITKVGLEDRMYFKASKLSGGEKQRVVIARALAKDSPIIAADEPTGNLDEQSSKEIIELLYNLSKDKLVLIVTHDFYEVEEYATRILRVYDGEIIEDRKLKNTLNISDDNEIIIENIDSKDEPIKKNKRKLMDNLSFYLKDLVSSPKRMIFYFICILLLTFFSLLTVATYNYENQSTGFGYKYDSGFYNDDVRRVVVNKKDRTKFSSEELNNIRSMMNVDFIVENDYVIDNYISINLDFDDDFNYIGGFEMTANVLKESDLKYGTLPKNSNEIVVTLGEDYFQYRKNESIIGMTTKDYYKIVGIVDPSTMSSTYATYVYLFDEDYKNDLRSNIKYGCSYIGNMDYYYYYYFSDVIKCDSLKDNEVGFIESKFDFTDGENFIFGDYYHNVISIENATFKTISGMEYYDYSAIYLSKNNYDKYNEAIDDVYQISIFLKNSSSLSHQTIKKLLEKDGYNAVSPSMDGKETNVISLVYGMMLTITLLVFFLSSTLILYFVLSFSIKSRLNDVEILRTIGAKQKDIKNMMVFELSFVGLISYLIILILSLIIKYNTVGTEIYQLINSIGVIHHLIVVVLVLTICVSASIMLTDKMFKKTVKKSLDQR